MCSVDVDEIFNIMRRSKSMGAGDGTSFDSDGSDDEPDEEGAFSQVCRLQDGTFHVCKGMKCPHVMQSTDVERHYVCTLTGLLVAGCMESRHDASWTGRSCGSADPDMASGAVKVRAWKTKRDAFNDSVRAYDMSASISIDESTPRSKPHDTEDIGDDAPKPEDASLSKRGAPCICDIDEEAVAAQKLSKAHKRASVIERSEVRTRLAGEASQVVRRLLGTLEGVTALSSQPPAASDPRFENYDFVFSVGMRRYIARCRQKREPVQLSEIHDICISSNTFVKQKRKDAEKRARAVKVKALATDGRTIDLCASLIVSIWSAVCITSHFMHHQSGDSFKPFASGIMYALKRGLWLPNGVMIIPQLDDLSDQLPVLRSLVASATAKQLQASSHKGLCALHKAITSIEEMEPGARASVEQRLSVSALIARDLKRHATIQ
jgi:hypothetical protein